MLRCSPNSPVIVGALCIYKRNAPDIELSDLQKAVGEQHLPHTNLLPN
jgi:hypothetical protein